MVPRAVAALFVIACAFRGVDASARGGKPRDPLKGYKFSPTPFYKKAKGVLENNCAGSLDLLSINSTVTHQRRTTSGRFRCGTSIKDFRATKERGRHGWKPATTKTVYLGDATGTEEPIAGAIVHVLNDLKASSRMQNNSVFQDMLSKFRHDNKTKFVFNMEPRGAFVEWTWRLMNSAREALEAFKVVLDADPSGRGRVSLYQCAHPGDCTLLSPRWVMYKHGNKHQQKSWNDSRAACVAAGHELASLHSEEDNRELNEWLRAELGHRGLARVWIGARGENNVFEWSDGSGPLGANSISTSPFQKWNSGEPSKASEECVETFVGEIPSYSCQGWNCNGGWNDAECQEKKMFVCQRDPNQLMDYKGEQIKPTLPYGSSKNDDAVFTRPAANADAPDNMHTDAVDTPPATAGNISGRRVPHNNRMGSPKYAPRRVLEPGRSNTPKDDANGNNIDSGGGPLNPVQLLKPDNMRNGGHSRDVASPQGNKGQFPASRGIVASTELVEEVGHVEDIDEEVVAHSGGGPLTPRKDIAIDSGGGPLRPVVKTKTSSSDRASPHPGHHMNPEGVNLNRGSGGSTAITDPGHQMKPTADNLEDGSGDDRVNPHPGHRMKPTGVSLEKGSGGSVTIEKTPTTSRGNGTRNSDGSLTSPREDTKEGMRTDERGGSDGSEKDVSNHKSEDTTHDMNDQMRPETPLNSTGSEIASVFPEVKEIEPGNSIIDGGAADSAIDLNNASSTGYSATANASGVDFNNASAAEFKANASLGGRAAPAEPTPTMPVPLIAGAAAGALILIAVIVLLLCRRRSKKRKRRQQLERALSRVKRAVPVDLSVSVTLVENSESE